MATMYRISATGPLALVPELLLENVDPTEAGRVAMERWTDQENEGYLLVDGGKLKYLTSPVEDGYSWEDAEDAA
jgi:hypothetical protein